MVLAHLRELHARRRQGAASSADTELETFTKRIQVNASAPLNPLSTPSQPPLHPLVTPLPGRFLTPVLPRLPFTLCPLEPSPPQTLPAR